jgi:hypothetical protein
VRAKLSSGVSSDRPDSTTDSGDTVRLAAPQKRNHVSDANDAGSQTALTDDLPSGRGLEGFAGAQERVPSLRWKQEHGGEGSTHDRHHTCCDWMVNARVKRSTVHSVSSSKSMNPEAHKPQPNVCHWSGV